MLNSYSLNKLSLLISLMNVLVRLGNVTNVLHVNVIVVRQNIFSDTSFSPSYYQLCFFNDYQSMF